MIAIRKKEEPDITGVKNRWAGKRVSKFFILVEKSPQSCVVPTKARFCVSASYTAMCVTKICKAFPDRATDEERKEPLVCRIVSFLSLFHISLWPHWHQHAYVHHIRPSYEIVLLAYGITVTRRYRALKLKACSCCVGTVAAVLFRVYYLPSSLQHPAGTQRG